MRKILLFTAFMLMLSLVITAQTNFGLKAGVNHASLYTYINKQSHKIGPMERLHFGASLDVHVSKTVSILTEANFNQLGASDKNSESDLLQNEYKIDYFSIPVMFKYNFPSGFSLYTGPQISFSYNAKNYNVLGTTDITNKLNEMEIATIFGAEFNFKNGVFVTGRYNVGQTNILKREYGSTDTYKNSSLTLALGIYFGKKK